MAGWPNWWEWTVVFTGHAELRMEQRAVSELDVRAMLHGARGFAPSVVPGRFMIDTTHAGRSWIVIVEPDMTEQLLVVVTVYEVNP